MHESRFITALVVIIALIGAIFLLDQYQENGNLGLPEVGIGGGPEDQTLPAEDLGVADIVERARPSVVTVTLTAEVPNLRSGEIETVEGNIGSGFIISSNGYIVTNKHVATRPAEQYSVIINDEEYQVERIFQDPNNDLAILDIDAENLNTLPLGNSENIRLGEQVIAIGTPLGEFTNSVTTGVVSGLDRNIDAQTPSGDVSVEFDNLIQTDAAINQGSSGGPLLNTQGEAIGVNTAVVGGAQNIGFAIPINELQSFLKTLPIDL